MKTLTRFFVLFTLIFLCAIVLCAQTTTKDVVYLKNGSVIKGTIIEMIPDKSLKIQTNDGSIFVYTMSEIDRISKETVQSTEPMNLFGGGGQSLPSRFSIFGGAAIPVGDFSDKINSEDGWAKVGFTVGAQYVTGGQIGFLVHASFSLNPADITADVFDPFDATNETGSWTSILILTGPKIGTTNTSGANFFFAPVLGLNIAATPKITGKISDTYYTGYPYYAYVPITGTGTIESASSTAFTYGAMAEAIIGDITIGARYIACKPTYDLKGNISFSGNNGSTYITGSGTATLKKEQNISIIFLYIGYAF